MTTDTPGAAKLYDLCGRDDRRFSPYCWRTRLAFAHKNLALNCQPTAFTEIAAIGTPDTGHSNGFSLPTIVVDGQYICDSAVIAQWLENSHPNAPALFGHESTTNLTECLQHWVDTTIHPQIAQLLVCDIAANLQQRDLDYFRRSREDRFGDRLEVVQRRARESVDTFRNSLQPLRLTISKTAFLGGSSPIYADYIVFGALQWARLMSDYPLLADNDPLTDWRNRVAQLYNSLGDSHAHYY